MMSSEQINRLSDEAEERARKRHTKPLPIGASFSDDREKLAKHLRSIPFIGGYLPPELERVERKDLCACQTVSHARLGGLWCDDKYLFVDSSGFGGREEGALSFAEFVDVVAANPDYRYAIVEQGQFQVVVGAFKPAQQVVVAA